jgi:hypothetical protein
MQDKPEQSKYTAVLTLFWQDLAKDEDAGSRPASDHGRDEPTAESPHRQKALEWLRTRIKSAPRL